MNNSQILPALPGMPGATPQADAAALRDFLTRHVSPHIHVMHSGPGFPGRYFGDDVEGAVAWACEANTTEDVYLTPNPVKPETNKKPTKADIVHATRAHADIDPAEGWDQSQVLDRLKADGASLVIDSGRGAWGYWTLDIPVNDQAAIEAVNIGIRDHYRAAGLGSPDAAQNIDRAARLPGTVNWKTGKLARVVHEVDTRHTLDALRIRFPLRAVQASADFDFGKPLPAHYRYSHMTDEQIVADLCADPALAALWNGDASAHADRSDADFALACAIVERARTPERAVELFKHSGLDPAKRPPDANKKSRSYVPRTLNEALKRAWQSEPAYIFRDALGGTLPPGAWITAPVPVSSRPRLKHIGGNKPYVPEPELVRGLIPLVGVGFIGGQSGAFKTFFAIHLATCLMTGESLINHKIERTGPVLYLAAEGDGTLAPRLAGRRTRMMNGGAVLPFYQITVTAPIDTDAKYAELDAAIGEAPEKPVAVIIDTVAAAGMIPPDKENDPGSWTRVFAKLNEIAQRHQLVITMVHHAGKDASAGLRGSSAARAAADFAIMLMCERDELTGDTSNHRVALAKHRSAPEGPLAAVTAHEVMIGQRDDGTPINTLTLAFDTSRRAAEGKGAKPVKLTNENQRQYMFALNVDFHPVQDWINRHAINGLAEFTPAQRRDVFRALKDKGAIVVKPDDDKFIKPAERFYQEFMEDLNDPYMKQ